MKFGFLKFLKKNYIFYPLILILVTIEIILIIRYRERRLEPADLVLLNGKIITLDYNTPEAQALAINKDRIMQVGTVKKIKRHIRNTTRVLDLNGALATPGLIESHGHYLSLGHSKTILDLSAARNWEEIIDIVQQAAKTKKPGEWILGRGWHQDKWNNIPEDSVKGLPRHDRLSQAAPENPVLLTHASGHSCLTNAKAMELSKISSKTPDPPGGEIVRDRNGRLTGAFIETAQNLVRYRESFPTIYAYQQNIRKLALLAAEECLAHGITTFHDAGQPFSVIDVYRQMADEEALPIRLYVMINESNEKLIGRGLAYRITNYGNYHLNVRAIKRLIDGALGSHGAWLLEPYEDLPSSTGLNTEPLESLKETAKFAMENGFQLCIHAIGDRANREVLNIYEEVFKANPDKIDLRWRIEHAQHLNLTDIPRFKQLSVIAAMQGIHCTSDAPWVLKRLGPKRAEEGAYVWRKLLDQGIVISNGTDVPVEPIDPLANFYASVTRKLKDGTEFFPAQKMTREEALRSYTINGAFAGFEDGLKGSLTPGKLADITVFSRDILSCPEDEILKTEVLYTIVGGKILYQRANN